MTTIAPIATGPVAETRRVAPELEPRPQQGSVQQSTVKQQAGSTRLSQAGVIQSARADAQEAARELTDARLWEANRATSSAPDIVSAAAHGAVPGTYVVQVDSVATAQESELRVKTNPLGELAITTVDIQLGAWKAAPPTFTSNPIWPRSSPVVGPGDTSLHAVCEKINANSLGVGVVARVISGSTGSRLVLSSRETGMNNGFDVQVDGKDAANLAVEHRLASDATGSVNGQPVRSASNLVENAVPGLTLRFNQPSTQAVTVTVDLDFDRIARTVSTLGQANNSLVKAHADPVVRARDLSEHTRDTLQSAGVSVADDGHMAVDPRRLTQTLQGPQRDTISDSLQVLGMVAGSSDWQA